MSVYSPSWMDGYNGVILDALADGDLEGMTFGHELTTRSAVEARFTADPGTELIGARAAVESDRYLVRHVGDELLAEEPDTGRRDRLPFYFPRRMKSVRALFAHDGRVLVLRIDGALHARDVVYRTYDLPSGIFLQDL